MIKTSRRIAEIVARIPQGSFVADVGCDHGQTLALAFVQGRLRGAQAIDNKPLPLSHAKETLKDCPGVIYTCADGLDEIADEADVVVMTGLGGRLIASLLARDPTKLRDRLFILSPQHKASDARAVFGPLGLAILDEDELICDGHDYVFIVARATSRPVPYDVRDISDGPVLRVKRPPAFIARLTREARILMAIPRPNEAERRRLDAIQEILALA